MRDLACMVRDQDASSVGRESRVSFPFVEMYQLASLETNRLIEVADHLIHHRSHVFGHQLWEVVEKRTRQTIRTSCFERLDPAT